MTDGLIYFTKEGLGVSKKLAILKEFYLYNTEENKVCPVCKTIQGREKNGFKKYYCIHTINRINKKIKKINVELLKSEIIFSDLVQDSF